MTLKTIIIDDEPFVRSDLSRMLLSYKQIEIAGEAGNLRDARKQLAKTRFDLVFLDICLRGGTGFELIPFINPSAKIVFITGHDEYAIQAFEINALDYLLKPVSRDRLNKTLMRIESRLEKSDTSSFDHGILVHLNSGHQFVPPDNIVVILSIGGNYICVHLKNNERLLCRKTLKEWESLLPDSVFLRIHRSIIVNTHCIKCISHEKDGSLRVSLFHQSASYRVSRRMAPRLKKRMMRLPSKNNLNRGVKNTNR
jgi:DNA-binding LytR/AlgR family response regulator